MVQINYMLNLTDLLLANIWLDPIHQITPIKTLKFV